MEASTKNVLWKCFENGGGKKLLFENELPDGFDYQVNRFKLLKESVIKVWVSPKYSKKD